ncbi:MAG: ANTAR domain-containing protein [Thermodesulfobacteriota bacterium]|nr:MAG: ANTAR domain-containing protein [Thermodesulfobacteriota bacterium]
MENCNQHGNCNFPRSICEKICTAYINLSSEAEVIRGKIGEKNLVNKAKWTLVEQKGLSEKEALGIMVRESRKKRQKLAETAALVLTGKAIEEPYASARKLQKSSGVQAG